TLFAVRLFIPLPPAHTIFPYTTLFRSLAHVRLLLHADSALHRLELPVHGGRPGRLGDLGGLAGFEGREARLQLVAAHPAALLGRSEEHTLNSSHVKISYSVFCLKKKKD